MSDDKDYLLNRTGSNIDTGLARQMIANADGPSGNKTRVMLLPDTGDGEGEMLVRTKNGMPQVTVTRYGGYTVPGANVLTEIDFDLRTYHDPIEQGDCANTDIIGVFIYPIKEVKFLDKDSQHVSTIYAEPPP